MVSKQNLAVLAVILTLVAAGVRWSPVSSGPPECSLAGISLGMTEDEVRSRFPNPRVHTRTQKAAEGWSYSEGLGNFPEGFLDVSFRFGKVHGLYGVSKLQVSGRREAQNWKTFSDVAKELGPPHHEQGNSKVYRIGGCRVLFSALDRGDGLGPIQITTWETGE